MARPCYLKEICVFVDAVVGLQGHASAIGSGCLLCFIFRSKATLPLAPDDPAPSTPPSVPLLPPAPLAPTAGYFPPGAQHRPENLTLVLCARDLSGACSRWCFLASLSLPPSSSGRVGLSSTTSKHTAACPVCRALRRPVAAHSSSVREVLYLPTFCG